LGASSRGCRSSTPRGCIGRTVRPALETDRLPLEPWPNAAERPGGLSAVTLKAHALHGCGRVRETEKGTRSSTRCSCTGMTTASAGAHRLAGRGRHWLGLVGLNLLRPCQGSRPAEVESVRGSSRRCAHASSSRASPASASIRSLQRQPFRPGSALGSGEELADDPPTGRACLAAT
jgi:hypothetical protein